MKRILVPTDFSENAADAAVYAFQVSRALQAHLVFCHFTAEMAPLSDDESLFMAQRQDMLNEASSQLQAFVEAAHNRAGFNPTGNEATLLVKEGELAQQVHSVIADQHIDLVVMGTRGASGLKKWFFGSNAAHVFDKAACPVVAVPMGARLDTGRPIAYATDLIHLEEEVAQLMPFAKALHTGIHAFHVYPVFPQQVDVAHFDRDGALERLRQLHNYYALDLSLVPTEYDNDLEGGIATFIAQHQPSLLAMFRQERTWFDRIVDPSNTKTMLMNAHLPLMAFNKA